MGFSYHRLFHDILNLKFLFCWQDQAWQKQPRSPNLDCGDLCTAAIVALECQQHSGALVQGHLKVCRHRCEALITCCAADVSLQNFDPLVCIGLQIYVDDVHRTG
jgi:hypothetical protein